jgi:hypothetical protein
MAPEVAKRLARVLLPNSQGTSGRPDPQNNVSGRSATPVTLTGTWAGKLLYPAGDIPLRLVIHDNGMAEVGFGRRPLVKMNDVSMKNGNFTGSTEGVLIRRPGFQFWSFSYDEKAVE